MSFDNPPSLALSLGLFSLGLVVSSVVVVVFLVSLPELYFVETAATKSHDLRSWAFRIAKNLVGAILVVSGIVLAIPGVPGQGLLTIVVGLLLMDGLGQRKLGRRLLRRPEVRSKVDGLRRRFGRPALQLDELDSRAASAEDGDP